MANSRTTSPKSDPSWPQGREELGRMSSVTVHRRAQASVSPPLDRSTQFIITGCSSRVGSASSTATYPGPGRSFSATRRAGGQRSKGRPDRITHQAPGPPNRSHGLLCSLAHLKDSSRSTTTRIALRRPDRGRLLETRTTRENPHGNDWAQHTLSTAPARGVHERSKCQPQLNLFTSP